EAVPALQGARSPLRPTGYAVYASPILFAGRDRPDSAMDARLATGGWLALTRQGLSPCKRCQAFLGAITLRLSCAWKQQRIGGWRSAAAGGLFGPRVRAMPGLPTAPTARVPPTLLA